MARPTPPFDSIAEWQNTEDSRRAQQKHLSNSDAVLVIWWTTGTVLWASARVAQKKVVKKVWTCDRYFPVNVWCLYGLLFSSPRLSGLDNMCLLPLGYTFKNKHQPFKIDVVKSLNHRSPRKKRSVDTQRSNRDMIFEQSVGVENDWPKKANAIMLFTCFWFLSTVMCGAPQCKANL